MAVAVPASLGVNTLGEFIDHVKKRPGQVNVAVLSRGGIPHLLAEWIKMEARLDMTSINYPGTPAGLADTSAGATQAIMDGLPSLAGAIEGGKLKLIAVGSAQRLPNRPDTPTIAETLPGIKRALGWFALMAPPGTPAPIAAKISDGSSRGAGSARAEEAVPGHRQLHAADDACGNARPTSARSRSCGSR